jgi:hypothetical protein
VPCNAVGDMAFHVLNRANGREKLFQRWLKKLFCKNQLKRLVFIFQKTAHQHHSIVNRQKWPFLIQ